MKERLFVMFLLLEWYVARSLTTTHKLIRSYRCLDHHKKQEKYVLLVSDRSYSYTIIPGPFTWQQGRNSCISEGMDLAVIKDLETHNEVHNFLTSSGW